MTLSFRRSTAPPNTGISNRYRLIRSHEERIAHRVAHRVMGIRTIGVWEFLIPVIFILSFMQHRQRRDLFVQNYLFTKRLALDAARDTTVHGTAVAEAVAGITRKTDALIDEAGGIYSKSIQQAQLIEIDLLMTHYCGLLRTPADSYDDLVARHYGTRERFTDFIDRLAALEHATTEAARQTLGAQVDDAVADRLESARAFVRNLDLERIFPPGA